MLVLPGWYISIIVEISIRQERIARAVPGGRRGACLDMQDDDELMDPGLMPHLPMLSTNAA